MSAPAKATEPTAPAAETVADGKPQPEVHASGGVAHWPLCLGIFIAWFAIDHLTKYWAETALKPGWWGQESISKAEFDSTPVIVLLKGFLELRYAENTGAAFSIMTGKVGVLAFISLVATVALSWFWYTLPKSERWGRVAVALILSGAVGNMIDRFFRGFVVDFILAYYQEWHWPVFNVADSCICVGAVILGIRFLRGKI